MFMSKQEVIHLMFDGSTLYIYMVNTQASTLTDRQLLKLGYDFERKKTEKVAQNTESTGNMQITQQKHRMLWLSTPLSRNNGSASLCLKSIYKITQSVLPFDINPHALYNKSFSTGNYFHEDSSYST